MWRIVPNMIYLSITTTGDAEENYFAHCQIFLELADFLTETKNNNKYENSCRKLSWLQVIIENG